MTSALNSTKELLDTTEFQQSISNLKLELAGNQSNQANTHSAGIGQNLYRDVTEKQPGISNRDYFLLGVLVVGLHVGGLEVYLHTDTTPTLQRPKKTEVVVEFVKPEVIPPPKIEPPPPPPPQPKVERQPAAPKPAPVLHTAPADQDIAPNDMTVKENTEAPPSSEPVAAEPSPPPAPPAPPPPKEEPITEAIGYAGYLNNPNPPYPPAAERAGWEGRVVLRIRVLPNGTAGTIEVKQSSKRKVLDDAAIAAVKGWSFAPAKRGNTPIEGWVTVPFEFKL